MPGTPILVLRFPDGDAEYRSTRAELPLGALVRARGRWRVRSYEEGAAVVELDAPSSQDAVGGAAAGPSFSALPTPLGDTPLTLEVLAEA